jgi:hypothetical protein
MYRIYAIALIALSVWIKSTRTIFAHTHTLILFCAISNKHILVCKKVFVVLIETPNALAKQEKTIAMQQ